MDDRVNPVHSLLMAILVVNSLVWMQTAMPMIRQKTKWMRRCIWLFYLIVASSNFMTVRILYSKPPKKNWQCFQGVIHNCVFSCIFQVSFYLCWGCPLFFASPSGVRRYVLRHLLPRCACQGWAARCQEMFGAHGFQQTGWISTEK